MNKSYLANNEKRYQEAITSRFDVLGSAGSGKRFYLFEPFAMRQLNCSRVGSRFLARTNRGGAGCGVPSLTILQMA